MFDEKKKYFQVKHNNNNNNSNKGLAGFACLWLLVRLFQEVSVKLVLSSKLRLESKVSQPLKRVLSNLILLTCLSYIPPLNT